MALRSILAVCILAVACDALTCNKWRSFTAADGIGIPSQSKMVVETCDESDGSIQRCYEARYEAQAPNGVSDDQQPGTSYCSGTCQVHEGGCTSDDSAASCQQTHQMSGNDATMTSPNDDALIPCPGNILITGHSNSAYNGEYVKQSTTFDANSWYTSSGGKFLFRYKYTDTNGQEHNGWALDETSPQSQTIEDGVRTADGSTVNSTATAWASGGGQEFTSANTEDANGNAIVSPVSCINDCFGESGDTGSIQMHCVAGSTGRRLFGRQLKGAVSNVQCGVCTSDVCNTNLVDLAGSQQESSQNEGGATRTGSSVVAALATALTALALFH